MTSRRKLIDHILERSRSNSFDAAKNEWELDNVRYNPYWDECPCGHSIKELCYIKNTITEKETYVGNICVKNFIGIDTGNLFSGLRRIIDDVSANANEDLIHYAQKFGYIYENEYQFLMDTKLRRNLSKRQTSWKEKINRRIINGIVVVQ